ncbi:hypothetical protein Nepgr_015051 [Nepenthes gracilis]|uniref:VQ domain-containing protein n=1 Tax=Nepenthes gracilis TaxID=150966 RepID=A0AAD3SM54_NEPGR|nr:hypothetical protein Nepgr_015051 [Nepenthes gracilis]
MDGRSGKIDQKRKSDVDGRRAKKEPLRVRYISSPILVNARSESEFRAVVQELTGKNSDGRSPTYAVDTVSADGASRSRECSAAAAGMDDLGGFSMDTVWSRGIGEDAFWREFSKNS